MTPKPKGPPVPLFDSVVFAPDRDHIPGARAVVSFDEGDEAPYLNSIKEFSTRQIDLTRRGHNHGSWAELDLSASGVDPLRHPVSVEVARERWQAARPLVIPGALIEFETDAASGLALGKQLETAAGLSQYLDERASKIPAPLTRQPPSEQNATPTDTRDITKTHFARGDAPDLWVKSGWLSNHETDRSLRLRISFGREVHDDVSNDETSQRAVTALAEALIPGAARIDLNPGLNTLLTELAGQELCFTQHIAYWNGPEGGALMHHDAFGEEDCGGQRGVVYTQIAGHTAWLALSLSDLAERVEDYCEFLESGGADWVRKVLWPDRRDFDRAQARIRNRQAFHAELVQPGCGQFGALINRGPEFTSFLADAGHAFILGPGDAVVMPSHSLAQTTMHSVFCASGEMTYGVSAALRGSPATGNNPV